MDKEIVEGNKLIVESRFSAGRYDNIIYYRDFCFKDGVSEKEFYTQKMKYHTSWDWLMPVVEKISELGYFVEIITSPNYKSCRIYRSDKKMPSCGLIVNEIPFNAIVIFINWYNQNKQQ